MIVNYFLHEVRRGILRLMQIEEWGTYIKAVISQAPNSKYRRFTPEAASEATTFLGRLSH
jgi:hypothetical protein